MHAHYHINSMYTDNSQLDVTTNVTSTYISTRNVELALPETARQAVRVYGAMRNGIYIVLCAH